MARSNDNDNDALHGGAMHVPRTRGAAGGLTLLLLGAWGLLIPFIGPYFDFAFTPNSAWTWTAARGWLEVLPGAVTVLGGLLMLLSANRVTTSLGAWLGVAGGAWFVVGRQVGSVLKLGSPGSPTGSGSGLRLLEELAFFTGLGTLIVFFAASALGRLSIRSVRDVKAARRRESRAADEQQRAYVEGQRDAATQIAQDSNTHERREQQPPGAYLTPDQAPRQSAESQPTDGGATAVQPSVRHES